MADADIEQPGAAATRPPAKRRGRQQRGAKPPARAVNYSQLRNAFTPQSVLSEDQVEAIHMAALDVLATYGIRVLHGEARSLLANAGADVDEPQQHVRLPRELVEGALATAPSVIEMQAAVTEKNVTLGGNAMAFVCVGGAPNFSDLDGGKRPGTFADTCNIMRLCEMFDVLHLQSPNVESQDLALNIRHLEVTRAQLALSRKVPFVYARGANQVADGFEMIRLARGLDEAGFSARPHCYTVINTNSPRQLDIPMCQGIIDFARAGQVSIITPFTLSGAMAPVTLAGALVLQHAEAISGIVLAQTTSPGAPVVYGSFTSNVDMKSGAPAFGTPEYIKAAMAGGQLARHIGLPWRGSAPNASNAPDAQGTYEFLMSLWGSVLGGANMVLHAAGWLEGGLTASIEKLILDVEGLQIVAESFEPLPVNTADLALDAIAEVEPGGHFFGAAHTMSRFGSAFYEPMVSDWRNFGAWTEDGAQTATQRANTIWKEKLAAFEAPKMDVARRDAIDAFVERRTGEGGAPPDS
ncbi:MAG: trimethylamine methyltransferase family protein [Pseudomonadota bacterium]